jgi:outer membrane protein OmpA-like peptidoglycan-associated protein
MGAIKPAIRCAISIVLGLTSTVPAAAQQKPPADRLNFLACPIVRDTKTVPCWLAEMNGEVYFLGIQEDTGAAWYPPQLGHKVLVEGTISREPRVCGGIVLKPLVTSVMPELDASCNSVLPAEDGFEAPEAVRGPGPSSIKPGSTPPARPAPAPEPPYSAREFTVLFDFDTDFMPIRVTRVVDEAARYARDIHAARVEITSFRGATLLSNGETLVENPLIAERRAHKLQRVLVGLGVPPASLAVTWKTEPERPDGTSDHQKRRAVIAVKP